MSSQELVAQSAQNGRNHLSLVQKDTAPSGANVGAVSIEQERAIAEAQGQMIMAKRFERDLDKALAELTVACSYHSFAATAFYSVPNRGSGPSIRFAEEVARVYGNFEFGHRELSRSEGTPGVPGKSEVEVYAWDKEKNNLSKRQITVMHVTDSKSGPKILRDQADIDNKIANVASKQVRGRILALLPKWLVEEAIQKCRDTLAGIGKGAEPIEVRLRKMQQAFAKHGVNLDHLERYLGHKIGETLADELADMMGIYNALKDGTPASEFFGVVEAELKTDATAAALAQAAQAGQNTQQTAQTAQATSTNKAPTPRARRTTTAAVAETPAAEAAAEVVQETKTQETASGGNAVSDNREQQTDENVIVGDSTIKNDQLESTQVVTGQADQAGDASSNNPDPAVIPEDDDVF